MNPSRKGDTPCTEQLIQPLYPSWQQQLRLLQCKMTSSFGCKVPSNEQGYLFVFPENQIKKGNVPVSGRVDGAERMMEMLTEKQQGRKRGRKGKKATVCYF